MAPRYGRASRHTDHTSTLRALAGIGDYWIVNIAEDEVEAYRDPSPGGYRDVSKHHRGDTLSLVAFPDLAVPIASILSPPRPMAS